jgi:hypothetical protein
MQKGRKALQSWFTPPNPSVSGRAGFIQARKYLELEAFFIHILSLLTKLKHSLFHLEIIFVQHITDVKDCLSNNNERGGGIFIVISVSNFRHFLNETKKMVEKIVCSIH